MTFVSVVNATGGLPKEGILIIDDDRALQRALRRLFESAGSTVQIAGTARSGLEEFQRKRPGAVILDLRLPDLRGQDVCREMKKQAPCVPVIVVSAVADVVEKIVLLETGADDYVTKPFSPRELLARVRAQVRKVSRCDRGTLQVFSFGDVSVDFVSMELTRAGRVTRLTPQEFKLLRFFVENVQRVVSRDELLAKVWPAREYVSPRTIDNHVLRLRHKLERDAATPLHFQTVQGSGYKFVP